MNVTKEEIKQFIKDSIEWLVDQDQGCSTLKLDDRLAICVGWLDGYDENDEDVIHSKESPSWAINAGLKVYTSDDMRTDYEFINSPYYANGEVVQTDVSVEPDANLDELADYFIQEYEGLKDLEIEEDGEILEPAAAVDDEILDKEEQRFEDSYEDSEEEPQEESLKEEADNFKNLTIEEMFFEVAGKKFKVFDKNGHFTKEAWKLYDKVANRFGDYDKFDALCGEEGCFEDDEDTQYNANESLKEEVISYNNCDEFLRKYGLDKYFEFDGMDLVDLEDMHTTSIKFGRNGSQEEYLLKQIKDYAPKLFKKLKIELKEESVKESRKSRELGLPDDVDIDIEDLDIEDGMEDWEIVDAIGDYLSNEYGYCHYDFYYEIKGDKVCVTDISWDTSESLKKKKSKQIKESWEGESVIDDLIERAQEMYDEGGYGDIDDCVAQAIDDGLIYTDDIRALADHYGVLPDDSDLIAEFYEYLRDDVYAGVEEHEPEEEEEEDDWEDEEESNESLKESDGEEESELEIEFWVDEDAREEGESDYYMYDIKDVEEGKRIVRKMIDRDGYASAELQRDGVVIFGYDGIDTWSDED